VTRLVVRTYTFVCDAPGCYAAIDGLTGRCEENSARAAWVEATAEGWTGNGGSDTHYCPEHSGRRSLVRG
jgi:hypothetical protein